MTYFPWEPAVLLLAKPLRQSVNPSGGDLCFGWLGSPRLYLYKPLGCVSTFWKWILARKNKIIQYQKVLMMLQCIPYIFAGLMSALTSLKLLLACPLATKQGKPGETIYFAGFVEYPPTFDISVFKKTRKYLCNFFKGTIIRRIVLHKELPFTIFCSMDFDMCP